MKVAICDDERICRNQILDIVYDYIEEYKDANIAFDEYSDPEALLKATREGCVYDIYILDIVMPGINGIQLGQALRSEGIDGKIIYLTSSEEYALDSFRVRAFDYLIKPITKQSFYSVMDEAIASIHIKKDRVLIVKTKESNARITFDSIIYVELAKRVIIYHLVGGKKVESTTLRSSFTEAVKELLSDKRFALCGASLVANLHHIVMVENEGIQFIENENVFLGKKACRELRATWNNYWVTEER